MKTLLASFVLLLMVVAQATPCQYITIVQNGRLVTCQVCYYDLTGWTLVKCG